MILKAPNGSLRLVICDSEREGGQGRGKGEQMNRKRGELAKEEGVGKEEEEEEWGLDKEEGMKEKEKEGEWESG